MGRKVPVIERFSEKFEVNHETGCWEWLATRCGSGQAYGQFWMNGRHNLAHRVSWELAVGPIPEGLVMDHLCRVRHCVNPDHLEPVTNRENTIRGNAGEWCKQNRHLFKKTHCPKGHEYAGANLYLDKYGRNVCRTCVRESGRRHDSLPHRRARKR